jgi:protoporphyrinogen/coproporphyrinogen III oxidase
MKTVAVIGGGISGLAAAFRFVELNDQTQTPLRVILFERSSRLGGVIQTEHRDGFLLESGPDAFISEKPAALQLAKAIGLEQHLIETNQQHRRSFILRNNRLRPVPAGYQLMAPGKLWPFITSDVFSWSGKARMALDLLLPKRVANGSADESLASFVRRRLGREALERMAQPMVAGIYTADPELLSLRATLPRFLEMEETDRSLILALLKRGRQQNEINSGTSGARYSLFLSFDSGMQLLVDKLSTKLGETEVRLNTRVMRVSRDESRNQWSIELQSGELFKADAVCLAVPSYVTASLLTESDAELAAELNAIPYESTATINFAYQGSDITHALDGFGFVVPLVEKRSLIACTFSSVKFAGRAPEGRVLLRAFVGGALQPELFDLDNDELTRRAQQDLNELLGIKGGPIFSQVSRWARSMPQYHMGHLERVMRINERLSRLPSLAVSGNAYSGPGIPDCIRSGETAAERLYPQMTQISPIKTTT